MAKFSRKNIEPISDDEIRVIYAEKNYNNLPLHIREYVLSDSNEYASVVRKRRIDKLLEVLMIERFLKT